jgi:hypothetical protein
MSVFSRHRRLAVTSAGAVLLGVMLPAASAGPASAAPASVTSVEVNTVTVPGVTEWYDTKLHVSPGLLVMTASGTIAIGNGTSFGPAGNPSCIGGPGSAVVGLTCDALVGRIGTNGTPFKVGKQAVIPVTRSGELYLSINDTYFPDNSGSFHVIVIRVH